MLERRIVKFNVVRGGGNKNTNNGSKEAKGRGERNSGGWQGVGAENNIYSGSRRWTMSWPNVLHFWILDFGFLTLVDSLLIWLEFILSYILLISNILPLLLSMLKPKWSECETWRKKQPPPGSALDRQKSPDRGGTEDNDCQISRSTSRCPFAHAVNNVID